MLKGRHPFVSILILKIILFFLFFQRAFPADDLPPGKRFYEFSSPPFLFLYAPGDERLLLHLLPIAHKSYNLLRRFQGVEPKAPIIVVLVTDHDITNGFTTVLPHNTIRLYPLPPRHPSLLMGSEDFYLLLFTHELAHVFHLDWAEIPASLTRTLLGRTLYPGELNLGGTGLVIPFCSGFPNLFLPDTLIEGYATLAESNLLQGGRLDSPLGSLYLRNIAYDRDLPNLSASLGVRRFFPLGDTPYLFGASFQRFLLLERPPLLSQFYRNNAQGCFPCFYCFPFLTASGILPENAWNQWRRQEFQKAQLFFEAFTRSTPYTRYSGPFLEIRSLFFDKKERRILATMEDGIHHEAIGTFLEGGEFHPIIPRHGGNFLFKEGDRFLYDEFEFAGDIVLKSQVVLTDRSGKKILGKDRFEPDLYGERWVSVVREKDHYCLEVRTLTGFRLSERFCEPFPAVLHHPRFTPDGRGIVFVREGYKTRSDIYLWELEGGRVTPLLASEENEWSPEVDSSGKGVYLLRVTDEVPDLHYLEISTSTLYRVTRIPIGMVEVAVDEEGGRIWFTTVGKDGFSLYSAPLPPRSSWEEILIPSPAPPPSSLPPSSPTLSSTPYTPLPSLLPTGFTPLLFFSTPLKGGGFIVQGEDPLRDFSYTLTPLLFASSDTIVGALSLGFAYDAGLWVFPINFSLIPGALLGEPSGFLNRLDLQALRRLRKIHNLQNISVGFSGEFHPGGDRFGLFGNSGYRLDTRRISPYFGDLGDGILLDLRLDEGGAFLGDRFYPDSHLSSTLLFSPLLFSLTPKTPLIAHLILGGGAHSNLNTPFRFTLLPPLVPLSLPRSFLTHASPPSGVSNLDRVGFSEIQLLFPLLWVNEGLFSLPLYLDGILLRPFVAGAIWEGAEGRGDSLFFGIELELDLLIAWNNVLPLRFGARYNPLLKQRESYFGIFFTDDLVLPRLKGTLPYSP